MAQQPIKVLGGIPLIESKDDEDKLKIGEYARGYNEKGEIQVFRKGDNEPLSMKWNVPEEFINNLLLGGTGAQVFGAIDYGISQIVPGGQDPTLDEAIAEKRSERELFREANPGTATLAQLAGSVGPTKVAKAIGGAIRKLPKIGKTVGAIPRYFRDIFGTAATVGAISAAEAEPGQRLQEFAVGAERGAASAAVLYPLFSAISLLGAVRGRVNPKWGARNLINIALSRHDLSKLGENVAEEELASLPNQIENIPLEVKNLPPAYRSIALKFMGLGPEATLVDAFPDGPQALLKAMTKQAGANRDLLKSIIEDRGRSETDRLVAIIDKNVSNLTADGPSLSKALSEAAAPYYDLAFGVKYERSSMDDSVPATEAQLEVESQRDFTQAPDYNTDLMNADIAQVLGTRSGEAAFKEALDSFRDEYFYSKYSADEAESERKRILQNAVYQGGVLKKVSSEARGFSLEFLDRVKRKLNARVSRLETTGDKDAARIVGNLATKLTNALDALDESPNKSYKVARETAKSRFDLQKAYDLGLQFIRQDADAIKKELVAMSEGERQLFRAGAARTLRNLVEAVPETGQATPRIAERTRSLNQILSLLPKKEAQQLRGDLARELTFAKTQKGTLGSGAGQFLDENDSLQAIKNISLIGASRLPGSNMLLFAGMVRRGVARILSGGVSEQEVVKMLLTQDQNQMQNILKALSAIPNDPNAMRVRDYVMQALAQKTRTLGQQRFQVPVQPNQYQMRQQPRNPLAAVLSGAYSSIADNF